MGKAMKPFQMHYRTENIRKCSNVGDGSYYEEQRCKHVMGKAKEKPCRDELKLVISVNPGSLNMIMYTCAHTYTYYIHTHLHVYIYRCMHVFLNVSPGSADKA